MTFPELTSPVLLEEIIHDYTLETDLVKTDKDVVHAYTMINNITEGILTHDSFEMYGALTAVDTLLNTPVACHNAVDPGPTHVGV